MGTRTLTARLVWKSMRSLGALDVWPFNWLRLSLKIPGSGIRESFPSFHHTNSGTSLQFPFGLVVERLLFGPHSNISETRSLISSRTDLRVDCFFLGTWPSRRIVIHYG